MTFRSMRKNDAVVGVITAILLTALVVAVLSLVQTVYVPEIMEQREAEHMNVIADQFASLKSVIDSQRAAQQRDLPIATSITLGSKELPYLMSVRAYGTLELIEQACQVNITNGTSGDIASFALGNIQYTSANGYYLDQTYIIEAGAMIVEQAQGDLMMIRPSLSMKYEGGVLSISFTMVNVTTIGGKSYAAGYGTVPIQTEYLALAVNQTIETVANINITSTYTNSWRDFLESALRGSGLPDTSFTLTEEPGEWLLIDFTTTGLTVNTQARVIQIGAQIGPGWVD